MLAAQVIAPAQMANNNPVKTRRGLASVSTIVNVGILKRHSVAYIPSLSWATKSMGLPGSGSGSVSSVPRSHTLSTSSIVTSLFSGHSNSSNNNNISNNSGSKRVSLDKAAERDWQEQAKQVFQLSTVNDQGNFVPPPPFTTLVDDIETLQQQDVDRDFDYFATTIVNTPPERVRTLLSTESTISPGMFSSPPSSSSKSRIKRHTISFPASASPSSSSPLPAAMIVPVAAARSIQPPFLPVAQTAPSSTAGAQPRDMNRPRRNSVLSSSQKSQVARTTAAPLSLPSTHADTLSTVPFNPQAVSVKDSNVYIGSSPPASPRPRRVQRSTDRRRSSTASLQEQQQQQQQQQQRQQQQQEQEQQRLVDDIKSHARSKTRAQISFLTGATLEEEEGDALLDPFSSMMSSSPVDVFGPRSSLDSSSSSSVASSPDTSPRRRSMLSSSSLSSFSPSSVQKDKERIWRMNAQKLRTQNNFE